MDGKGWRVDTAFVAGDNFLVHLERSPEPKRDPRSDLKIMVRLWWSSFDLIPQRETPSVDFAITYYRVAYIKPGYPSR